MWKSSRPSRPMPDGGRAPTVAVTSGRAGRLARHEAGMRTTTPALSRSGTLDRIARPRPGTSAADEKSPRHRPLSLSQPQRSAARCTGTSSESSASRFAAPAYSRKAWPSGTCWALACGRQPRGVGRHEGEGLLRIVPVFRQIEMHPPDQIPGGVQVLEKGLKIGSRPASDAANAAPSSSHSASRISASRYSAPGIIGAVSTRVAISASLGGGTLGRTRRRSDLRGCAWGVQAQRPDIARRKVAPPDEDGRQGLADLTRPELHEAVPSTPAKSLGKPLRDHCPEWAHPQRPRAECAAVA